MYSFQVVAVLLALSPLSLPWGRPGFDGLSSSWHQLPEVGPGWIWWRTCLQGRLQLTVAIMRSLSLAQGVSKFLLVEWFTSML